MICIKVNLFCISWRVEFARCLKAKANDSLTNKQTTYLLCIFTFSVSDSFITMGDNVPGVKPTDRDLRSAEKPPDIVMETKVLGDVSYSSVAQLPPTQIPTGSQVMGRMMSFLYRTDKVGPQPKVDEAARAIAEEISDLHIYNLNIYPMT